MGRFKDCWKCLGFKLGVTITDAEGRTLMDERAVTLSTSAYVDQGEEPGEVEQMVEKFLKETLAKDERDARARLRGIYGQHVPIVMTPILGAVEETDVVPPPKDEGIHRVDDDGDSMSAFDENIARQREEDKAERDALPNCKVWFGPYEGQQVSDMDLAELHRNQQKGKIYSSGMKEGAMRADPDAYHFAIAVDAWAKFWEVEALEARGGRS